MCQNAAVSSEKKQPHDTATLDFYNLGFLHALRNHLAM
jgi:hypothetical protein